MIKKSILSFAVIIFVCANANAQKVFKCKDSQGRTVFSQTECDNVKEVIQIKENNHNIEQGNSRSVMEQLEAMRQISGSSSTRTPKATQSVNQDPCPKISGTERHNLLVSKKLFKCMTQSEVKRVLERGPDSVHTESDGESSWHYHFQDGSSTHIFFDNESKVESWSGWN